MKRRYLVLFLMFIAPLPVYASSITADEAGTIAQQAFIYGFGPILLETYRQAGMSILGDANRMVSIPSTSRSDAEKIQSRMVYSMAYLDLVKEPMVICHREGTDSRFMVRVLDAYGNTRFMSGGYPVGARDGLFAISGPGWKGTIPKGLDETRCPTRGAWIFARTMDHVSQLSLTPLSLFSKGTEKRVEELDAADLKVAAPLRQVLLMDMQAFFGRLALFMKRNPPPPSDHEITGRMAKIGIDARTGFFDTSALSASARRAVEQGMMKGMDDIRRCAREGFEKRGQWVVVSSPAADEKDYLRRSAVLYICLGEPLSQGFTLAFCTEDGLGKSLHGKEKYVVRLHKDMLPLSTAYWSLSLLDADFSPMPRRVRHAELTSLDRLATEPDGSIDIQIQRDSPGQGRESNWLSTADGNFTLVLKVFRTGEQMPAGGDAWPEVMRMEGR